MLHVALARLSDMEATVVASARLGAAHRAAIAELVIQEVLDRAAGPELAARHGSSSQERSTSVGQEAAAGAAATEAVAEDVLAGLQDGPGAATEGAEQQAEAEGAQLGSGRNQAPAVGSGSSGTAAAEQPPAEAAAVAARATHADGGLAGAAAAAGSGRPELARLSGGSTGSSSSFKSFDEEAETLETPHKQIITHKAAQQLAQQAQQVQAKGQPAKAADRAQKTASAPASAPAAKEVAAAGSSGSKVGLAATAIKAAADMAALLARNMDHLLSQHQDLPVPDVPDQQDLAAGLDLQAVFATSAGDADVDEFESGDADLWQTVLTMFDSQPMVNALSGALLTSASGHRYSPTSGATAHLAASASPGSAGGTTPRYRQYTPRKLSPAAQHLLSRPRIATAPVAGQTPPAASAARAAAAAQALAAPAGGSSSSKQQQSSQAAPSGGFHGSFSQLPSRPSGGSSAAAAVAAAQQQEGYGNGGGGGRDQMVVLQQATWDWRGAGGGAAAGDTERTEDQGGEDLYLVSQSSGGCCMNAFRADLTPGSSNTL